MIEDFTSVHDEVAVQASVAVVGAGPAGIVTALELARRGVDVVLLESGGPTFDAEAQELVEAARWDQRRHAPMSMAVRRQIGGTSTIWGGRCVPYDPVDFDSRHFVDATPWPVDYEEMQKYFQRALRLVPLRSRCVQRYRDGPSSGSHRPWARGRERHHHVSRAVVTPHGLRDRAPRGVPRLPAPPAAHWRHLCRYRMQPGIEPGRPAPLSEPGRRRDHRDGDPVRRRRRRARGNPAVDGLDRAGRGPAGQRVRAPRALVHGPHRRSGVHRPVHDAGPRNHLRLRAGHRRRVHPPTLRLYTARCSSGTTCRTSAAGSPTQSWPTPPTGAASCPSSTSP